MAGVPLDRAVDEMPRDDAAGPAVADHDIEHLAAGVDARAPRQDLATEGPVATKQQLLAGLSPGVEGARHLRPTERPVREQPPVLARERDALGHTVVDDGVAQRRESIDACLA